MSGLLKDCEGFSVLILMISHLQIRPVTQRNQRILISIKTVKLKGRFTNCKFAQSGVSRLCGKQKHLDSNESESAIYQKISIYNSQMQGFQFLLITLVDMSQNPHEFPLLKPAKNRKAEEGRIK